MLLAAEKLSPEQIELIERPLHTHIFLEGPAGVGKTTVGVERLLHLMAQGVRADTILLLVPQRTLGAPYQTAMRHPGVVGGGSVDILTIGGLARRMVDLFWPLIAEQAGFSHPTHQTTYLTLETAQYFMARLLQPMFAEGYFSSVTINHHRLYSQVIDNLNKSALIGIPYTDIGERLSSAWVGESSQGRIYGDVQEAAIRFRQFCLAHNLLDFSLQMEVFLNHLWPLSQCQDYLKRKYRHLIIDNLEEDTPAAHDVLQDWLPSFESALLIYDLQAGYRLFLGADPTSAYSLKSKCKDQVLFSQSFVTSPDLQIFADQICKALHFRPIRSDIFPHVQDFNTEVEVAQNELSISSALDYENHRYHPQMLDWVAAETAQLIHEENVNPGEIVILAPYMPDALRFSLIDRLQRYNLPVQSHRPSRALRDEPATRCLVTLAALAHPQWGFQVTKFDLAYALIQAIKNLDLVRAQLLAEIVLRTQDGHQVMTSFDRIKTDMQERITYYFGEHFEILRIWLEDYAQQPTAELDYFLSRLFGEVLSVRDFGFHEDFDAGRVVANLIESARKFRWAVGEFSNTSEVPIGKEYLQMVLEGVVAAQYLQSWDVQQKEAVFLAPAYTYLLSNRAVNYQFWLDVGAQGWAERLYQPLTQPYVLSRNWIPGDKWTDDHEQLSNQLSLERLVLGLIRRCRCKIYLGLSELGESGYEQKGPFLRALQRVLRQSASGAS